MSVKHRVSGRTCGQEKAGKLRAAGGTKPDQYLVCCPSCGFRIMRCSCKSQTSDLEIRCGKCHELVGVSTGGGRITTYIVDHADTAEVAEAMAERLAVYSDTLNGRGIGWGDARSNERVVCVSDGEDIPVI